MEKHFVRFLSAGTFVAEETTKEIDSWDVEKAKNMSKQIIERHDSHPYGFQFITRSRSENDLDSKIVDKSGVYYINGVVETVKDIEAKNDPNNDTLLWNMKTNHWNKVVTTYNPWKWTQPFNDRDRIVKI